MKQRTSVLCGLDIIVLLFVCVFKMFLLHSPAIAVHQYHRLKVGKNLFVL